MLSRLLWTAAYPRTESAVLGPHNKKTFGNGTFRKIGELDKDVEAQEELVNSL